MQNTTNYVSTVYGKDVLGLFLPHFSDLSQVPPGLRYCAADKHIAVDRSNSLKEVAFWVAFHGKIAVVTNAVEFRELETAGESMECALSVQPWKRLQ